MRPKLVRIEISGFRRLQSRLVTSVRYPNGDASDLLVIAGSNGSGKTSLLEAILLALGREDLIVRDLPSPEREGHWRGVLPETSRIRLDFRVDDQTVAVVRTAGSHTVHVVIDEPGTDTFGQFWAWEDNPVDLPVQYFSSWRGPALPGAVKPMGSGRRPAHTETNRLWLIKQRIIDERARKAFSADPSAARDTRWLERINDVWAPFHGHDGTRIEAEISDAAADDPEFDLYIRNADDTRRCSIDQASSGELELFALIGSLLLDDFDGLCLIDEAELHLHKEWQSAILSTLTALAPRAQFVVTTHADAPWDQSYSFQRLLLVDDDDPRVGQATGPLDARKTP